MNQLQHSGLIKLLSSNIFTTNVLAGNGENITLFGVSRNYAEGIADYLREKLRADPNLTLRGIAGRSGGSVTHSYLSKILSGAAKNPSIEKLRAIADGIPAPLEEVLAAAGGQALEFDNPLDEVRVMFTGWDEAPEEERRATMDAIRRLAESFQMRRQRRPPSPRPKTTKGKGKK